MNQPPSSDATPKITPRTLQGFRDYLPEAMIPREKLLETARRVYRSFGYSPIDTPALEYLEILAGKGGEESDRLMYHFEDHGGRKVGMRFDLTVPLARFAAQHAQRLGTPFKRYHLATVWRGERAQHGRYREFMQCDFDTIGVKSLASDVETTLVIHELLRAIGLERFTIRLNDRRLLNGLLEKLGLQSQSAAILRALDKLAKIGPLKVAEEMRETAGVAAAQAEQVLRLTSLEGDNDAVLARLEPLVADAPRAAEAAAHLRAVLAGFRAGGGAAERLRLDVSIARGLDYYTGVVFETTLDDLPGIGSVCSGGRYDNLAELYTTQELPGIGASLGVDRLLTALEELGALERVATPAPVLVVHFTPTRLHDYLALAARVRAAGLGVEVYPEPKKLGAQLKYADRKGFRAALIAGDDEFAAGVCLVKDLKAQTQTQASLAPGPNDVVAALRQLLGPTPD